MGRVCHVLVCCSEGLSSPPLFSLLAFSLALGTNLFGLTSLIFERRESRDSTFVGGCASDYGQP